MWVAFSAWVGLEGHMMTIPTLTNTKRDSKCVAWTNAVPYYAKVLVTSKTLYSSGSMLKKDRVGDKQIEQFRSNWLKCQWNSLHHRILR